MGLAGAKSRIIIRPMLHPAHYVGDTVDWGPFFLPRRLGQCVMAGVLRFRIWDQRNCAIMTTRQPPANPLGRRKFQRQNHTSRRGYGCGEGISKYLIWTGRGIRHNATPREPCAHVRLLLDFRKAYIA